MKIIFNNIIPFKGFSAINLFGVVFARKGVHITETTISHECIHTRQMQELLFVTFYVLYVLEWLVKLCFYGKRTYYNISFEREAYAKQDELLYLRERKHFAFLKYLF